MTCCSYFMSIYPTPTSVLFMSFPLLLTNCSFPQISHHVFAMHSSLNVHVHTSLCTAHLHIFPIPPHTSFMFFPSLVRYCSYSYMPLPFLTHCSCSHTTHPSSDTVHVHILPILTYCSCSYTLQSSPSVGF